MPRIHILGASGTGTTTLGAVLAKRLDVPHRDADAFFWLPTDPPFTARRPRGERIALLRQQLPATGHWVFSGSALGWGDGLGPFYDLVVFLRLDPGERGERLRRREIARYGTRVEAGGDMAAASAAFLAWAASYETGGPAQRSLAAHEAMLAAQTVPVLRLDAAASCGELVEAVCARLSRIAEAGRPAPSQRR